MMQIVGITVRVIRSLWLGIVILRGVGGIIGSRLGGARYFE